MVKASKERRFITYCTIEVFVSVRFWQIQQTSGSFCGKVLSFEYHQSWKGMFDVQKPKPGCAYWKKFLKSYKDQQNFITHIFQAAMYFIQEMDSIVAQSYVVVYLHTETTKENQPQLNFIKDIYNLVDERYCIYYSLLRPPIE